MAFYMKKYKLPENIKQLVTKIKIQVEKNFKLGN